jgi:hypothetical protein
VLGNRVLKRLDFRKRKLNYKEFHNFCSSQEMELRMKLVEYVASIMEMRKAYKILIKKLLGKRSHGRRKL